MTTIHDKKEYEGVPISEHMYTKSQDLTKKIYDVTIMDDTTPDKVRVTLWHRYRHPLI
jgi:hypothetical protein